MAGERGLIPFFQVFFERNPDEISQEASGQGCDELGQRKGDPCGGKHSGQSLGLRKSCGDIASKGGKQDEHDYRPHKCGFQNGAQDQTRDQPLGSVAFTGVAFAGGAFFYIEKLHAYREDNISAHNNRKHEGNGGHNGGAGNKKCADRGDDADQNPAPQPHGQHRKNDGGIYNGAGKIYRKIFKELAGDADGQKQPGLNEPSGSEFHYALRPPLDEKFLPFTV